MKIAVWHNLPSGGGSRALHDQVKGLVNRGHHVEIWCPPTANRTFLPLGHVVKEHVLPMDIHPRPVRFPLLRLTLKERNQLVAEIAAMDLHCRRCAGEIDRGGFDVLLAHASMGFHPTPIGRHVAIPSAIYLQEPNRRYYEAMPRLPWLAFDRRGSRPRIDYYKKVMSDFVFVQSRRVLIREELESATDFDLILANSLFSRESFLRAYNLESTVCYLGVDVHLFQPTTQPKEPYAVGLGNIAENKRPELAIRALGTIEESLRPELIWVGNHSVDHYLRSLTDLATELNVRFRPKVDISNAELVDILARASVMIYTSRLEPFGYAPLEANACGTAVVAVAEGGVRETVVDGLNGTLISGNDPAGLGLAVRKYCTDPDLARTVGLAARRNVEAIWSLDAALDRLERQLVGISASAAVPART